VRGSFWGLAALKAIFCLVMHQKSAMPAAKKYPLPCQTKNLPLTQCAFALGGVEGKFLS